MKLSAALFSLLILTSAAVLAQKDPATEYSLTEDSKPHDGVPKGELLKFTFDQSRIFPGTTRNVTVYVPRQYAPAKPACVWVNQDGVQHNAPVVFDNLIAKGHMPVTIYIAASPGVVKALDPAKALDRFNRSFEYDGLGDAYARFVIEELLPFVEKQKTTDGRAIVLSKSGNDRCIGGSSSGAICAFTAAWERPDAFRRVFSSIGTYVGLRGGDRYPTLIRKFEPKPLRIFLQDGDHDQNIYGGDWWMANQMMERALTFAGYEVNHAWGTGGHDGKQAAAIFPDAVRWLWKDWPKEPQAGAGSPQLQEILLPGEKWEVVGEGFGWADSAVCNAKGEVFFNGDRGKTVKIGIDRKVAEIWDISKQLDSQAFGPDGRLYQIEGNVKLGEIAAYDERGVRTSISHHAIGSNIFVLRAGHTYVDTSYSFPYGAGIILLGPNGRENRVGYGGASGGFAASPDQSLLYTREWNSHYVWSHQVQPDGSLKLSESYCHLHRPDTEGNSFGRGMTVDSAGRLYVATGIGIQICDQTGRVNCIIPAHPVRGIATSLTFGGANFDTLFVTCGKVFKRKLKVRGAPAFLPPVKPAPPRL